MGKKNRKKTNRKPTRKKKFVQPDDYFRAGPYEVVRFGKFVVQRSNMTKEQFERLQEELVKRFPAVCREIDAKVSKIASLVKVLNPSELLKRAYWEFVVQIFNKKSEFDLDAESTLSLRMLDYIQSVIASVPPDESAQQKASDKQWLELNKTVEGLFTQVNTEYQICRTAFRRKKDPKYDVDFEEYFFKAQLYWCNIRGHRYLFHQAPHLHDLLSPHDHVLNELFGIKSNGLVDSINKIMHTFTHGINEVVEDFDGFRHDTLEALKKKVAGKKHISKSDLPGIMSQVIEENKWESRRDDIFGRLFDLNLFDIEKISNLPKALLDEMSWEPGKDTEFFEEGNYKGWPLRIWPIFKRPFIKLNNRYYVFEIYSLLDNLYRVLQRIIINRKPEYLSEWNEKQKNLSEQIPLGLFQKLLPCSQYYKSVYYRWHTSQGKPKQWCEADGLLIYDDHLFIIEVKAGAFTYTSPATDFPAYLESIKNLVLKPVEQGKRFLEYFESEDEVSLFDKNHNQITKISKNNFEHITLCAVTLDPFTELAAQAEHLNKIGIDVGVQPAWSISIDDLRVCADVFDNPLKFLHFVEQRNLAFKSHLIKAEDELDHIGLYLNHNAYAKYAQGLNLEGKSELIWQGYRTNLDRYFANKMLNPNIGKPPQQKIPARLNEIIKFLSNLSSPGRRKLSSTLLDCNEEMRNQLATGIEEVLRKQSLDNRPKPLCIYSEIVIIVFCWQKDIVERDRMLALEHSKAAMLISKDKEALLLELTFDQSAILIDIHFDFLRPEDLSEQELEKISSIAEELKASRIAAAFKTRGKIERNETCPCGSGKKYKRCCMLRKT